MIHDFADGCGDGADVMRLVECGLGTDAAVAADYSWGRDWYQCGARAGGWLIGWCD